MSRTLRGEQITEEWLRQPNDFLARDQGCYVDLDEADRFYKFLTNYVHYTKGEKQGEKFIPLEWQWKELLRPMFAWKRPDGRRRFNNVELWVPKKNGKSTMLSAIALYGLFWDREPGANVYVAAVDRQQASIIFLDAADMIRRSPDMDRLTKLKTSIKEVYVPSTNSYLKALSADVRSKEGLDASMIIYDELHEAASGDMFEVLRYAGRARRQPLFIVLSTAGSDLDGIGYERFRKAQQVAIGEDPDIHTLAVVYAAAPQDDVSSEEVWKKCNPSIGETLNLEALHREWEEAQKSEAALNSFKRYTLNLWVKKESKWLEYRYWVACSRKLALQDVPVSKGDPFYGGIDLSSTRDLTAVSYVKFVDDHLFIYVKSYAPEEADLQRVRSNKARFDKWFASGALKSTPGNAVDYNVIIQEIDEFRALYPVRDFGIDKYNWAKVANDLIAKGVKVEPVSQTAMTFNAPMKFMEKLILDGKVIHNSDPVLDWNFRNLVVRYDSNNNLRPDKGKCVDKIDGFTATLNALVRWMVANPQKMTIYKTRGIITL